MTFAFAAAGTGGHVYPALAVAEELVRRGVPRSEIVFLGGDRMERDAVPGAGFDLVQVELRGLRRSLDPANLTLPRVVARATRTMTRTLADRDVGVIGVFGGYVTVPAVRAARRRGVPVVVHEQNAVPGLANRYACRAAARVLVAFPDAARRLPRAVVVGNPLRSSLSRFDRHDHRPAALRRYGLDADRPVLGVLGGSQGAAALNEAAARFVEAHGDRFDVVHLTGRMHLDGLRGRLGGHRRWRGIAFEDDMAAFYAASDLVLARAGALTVSELAVTGTPAILVPYPSGRRHQAANAAALVEAGGAVLVDQSRLEEVPGLLLDLLDDGERRRAMATAAAGAARRDATALVAEALVEVHR